MDTQKINVLTSELMSFIASCASHRPLGTVIIRYSPSHNNIGYISDSDQDSTLFDYLAMTEIANRLKNIRQEMYDTVDGVWFSCDVHIIGKTLEFDVKYNYMDRPKDLSGKELSLKPIVEDLKKNKRRRDKLPHWFFEKK